MTLTFNCRFRYASGFELEANFAAGDSVTAICGPSGSGKTTILGLVSGLLRPSAGRISLDEQVLVDTDKKVFVPPQNRGVGLVSQDDLLFPHMSVRRNLTYGLSRKPVREISFDRLVEVLELGQVLDRRPTTLSGGQARRVALGRALLRGPSLLMLDEPLTGLEEELKDKILGFLERSLEEWKIPALLVSHDPANIERLGARVIALSHGRLAGAARAARDEVGPGPA